MEYTRLGRTGLQVSRLCLGTMNFGPETTPEDSHALMDRALELGFNFFDTADVYGWKKGEGWTETIIGDWFARGGRRRDRVVLATKFYGHMGDGPNDRGCSAYHIRAACEDSLRRLRTDHIDLYQMHHIDRTAPWDEVWQALEQLVAAGKVLYAGSSNFAGWQLATANQEAKHRGFLGLVAEQSKYSLACRDIELEVVPACRHYGIGIIPWSPLDGGLLGGVLGGDMGRRRSGEGMRKKVDAMRPTIEKWEALCAKLGERPADVALAWLLRNPVVTAPIIGPRTRAHLDDALRALSLKLDAPTVAAIEALWPGPKGEAPEAYAW
jgi:aryl-alcohol dehydrogenase-like predicted oxidoreductase